MEYKTEFETIHTLRLSTKEYDLILKDLKNIALEKKEFFRKDWEGFYELKELLTDEEY